jgi:hypothetical protein
MSAEIFIPQRMHGATLAVVEQANAVIDETFGTTECWELDALSPTVIADLIRTEIEGLIEDREEWDAARTEEEHGRNLLQGAAENWSRVENLLRTSNEGAS